MSDQLRSTLRTVVPGIWSALVAWLVSVGAPAAVTDALGAAFEPVIYPLVLAGVYAALRAVEPKLPAWLTRILLGSNEVPKYTTE